MNVKSFATDFQLSCEKVTVTVPLHTVLAGQILLTGKTVVCPVMNTSDELRTAFTHCNFRA